MSLTIIVGQPGSGKSKAIRDRYLKASRASVFFDGHHGEEIVRQIRHEMGYLDHRYLSCSTESLWAELGMIDDASEVFIDMPNLPAEAIGRIQDLAAARDWDLTITARRLPERLDGAEVIQV